MARQETEEAAAEERAAPPHRPWRTRFVKLAAGGMLAVLALVGLLLFGIDTGPGHRFAADRIGKLRFENGLEIRVGRIDGSIYGKMILRDLSLRDPAGEFLFAPEVRVDWRPLAYLGGHVDVRSATAERMILRRVPKFRATPPSDEPLLPDLDIDIGRLRVASFIAEKPVSGERRVAALDGRAHIADGRAQVDFAARTISAPGRAGGDSLDLHLDAVPQSNRLALDFALKAPAGGVIAALAGWRAPLTLRAGGKGDWRAWDGRIDADYGTGELARLTLAARGGKFALSGPARLSRLFEGVPAALLGPVTRIDLNAALKDRRAAVSGTIASDSFTLAPAGLIDFSDNSFDQLKLAFDLTQPSALGNNLAGAGLRGLFVLQGPFATPRVTYALSAERLASGDMALNGLTASGDARVDAGRIVIPVAARVARITGLDSVAGGVLTDVRLDGDLAIEGPRILSDNLRLRSPRIDAGLVLAADTATGVYMGAIDGKLDDYRVQNVGIFNIVTDLDLKSRPQGFVLAGKVRARSTRVTNSGVAGFLGGNAVASSDVRYGPDGVVRFSSLRLEAPDVRITGGSGSYSPDGRLALDANAISRRYGRIGVRVAGTIADPDATIVADRPGLGIGLANLRARVIAARGGYRLSATGETDYGPLTADVTLGTGRATTLLINNANLGGVDFAGLLRQTPAGPFAGRLTVSGQGVSGLVRLGAQGRYQEALVNLRARDTVLPGPARLSVRSAIVDARVILYDRPTVVADAQVSGAHFGAFDLAAARVTADYRNGRGSAKALVEGTSGVPFRMAVNADLQPGLWRVMLDGKARGVRIATRSPARIIPGKSGYELLPTRLALDSGSLVLAGIYGRSLDLQTRMEAVDLALVNAFVPGLGIGGKATGSLDFAQASAGAFPRADARLTVAGFTRTTAVSVSQPVDVNFVGKLLADGGEARAVLRRRGTVIGRAQASLRPLGPGAGSWTARLFDAPLGGGIRYNGPADTLFSFVGQPGHSLSGPIALAADFSCRVSRPCLDGIVRSNALAYENHTYGTRLTKMVLAGRFVGDRLDIEKLDAAAGSGRLSATGRISLSADAGYPMDIAVTLDNARLARGEDLSARATGALRLTKAAGETALLSGKLRLPETRYRIVREGAAQVPSLSGVRFKPPRGPVRVTGDEPATPVPGLFERVRLDIALNAPEKLYVSGMGLESEWRAKFTVGGTSSAMTMTGQVDLLRGTLGFAGHSFDLTRGRLNFTGSQPADPAISLTGTDDIEGVSVNVNVSGLASNPQVAFSSVPGLPQDEIMARILFGDSISNLSAIQAVQLAASLNALRGSGGGLNPLGKLRSATGIDRLRVLGPDETTGRGTALAAGQYITNDIFVEVITDARGFTATQLEVALTKWLSLMSQAGGSGVNNVSARIKKDY